MTNDRTRKLKIRDRMATTGEVFSVAAKNIDAEPASHKPGWQAFLEGFGNTNPTKVWRPEGLNYWTQPVYSLVTSAWEGDTTSLHALGAAYKALEMKGHYFCFHHYTVEYIQSWFSQKQISPSMDQLRNTFNQMHDTFQYLEDHRWFDSALADEATVEAAQKLVQFTEKDIITRINESLQQDVRTAKNTNFYTTDGIIMMSLLWSVLSQDERIVFVDGLTKLLKNLPSVEEANTDDIIYSRYYVQPPIARPELAVGDEVKFKKDGQKWTVRGSSENYTVLTRVPKSKTTLGQDQYTIVDWSVSNRGAHSSYGHAVKSDADVQTILEVLEDSTNDIELSRNQVPCRIELVKKVKQR